MLAILFYVRTCPHIEHLFVYSADIAVKPSASHQPTFSRDGEVAVATVAAIVNRVIVKPFWNLEQALLVEEQCPEVILQIKSRIGVFVLLELRPAFFEEFTVALRLYVPGLLVCPVFGCWAVAAKGEDVGLVLYDDVNQLRYLIDIRSRERTGFTESVVRLAQSVE